MNVPKDTTKVAIADRRARMSFAIPGPTLRALNQHAKENDLEPAELLRRILDEWRRGLPQQDAVKPAKV